MNTNGTTNKSQTGLDTVYQELIDIANDDLFIALADIGEGDDRRYEVELLAERIGAADRTVYGRLAKAILIADPSFTRSEADRFIKACASKVKRLRKEQAAAELAARKEKMREEAVATRSGCTIVVGDRQLNELRAEVMTALVQHIEHNPRYPSVFVKVGALSRVVCDENGIYSSQEVKPGALPGILSDAARFVMVHETDTSYREVNVFPPKDVTTDILNLGKWHGVPPLNSVVSVPVFGKDGTLHCEAGYDRRTQLYYTGGVTLGDTTPTAERVAWAKEMLLVEMMGDFPFKDEASRAHALAYTITPFVREMIPGPIPPVLYEAPTEGTGKGKLMAACAYPALGRPLPSMADTDDENEWRKRITGKLLEGATHVVIDNVNRELASGVLASVWTQDVWDDRTLGANRNVSIPNRMIWAISANNIQMSRENARRVVWCRLDANMEKPWLRDVSQYRHPDLMEWVADNRAHLVTAAIILVRSWLEAGRPKYTGRSKGSYEAWSKVVGGIFQHVGVAGFLGNEDELFDHVVNEADEMGDFIQAWWNKYGDAKVGSRSLFKLASVSDDDANNRVEEYKDLLRNKLTAIKERGRQTQLGSILKNAKDRVYRGFKVLDAGLLHGETQWRLVDHRSVNEGAVVEVQL